MPIDPANQPRRCSGRLVLAATFVSSACLANNSEAAVVVSGFNVESKMMLNTTTLMQIGQSAPDHSPIVANVGSAAYGSTSTSLTSTATFLQISSTMTPTTLYRGSSLGNGLYDITVGRIVEVKWAWSHTSDSGGWRIVNSANETVFASLTFTNGTFTTVGGSWPKTASGTTNVTITVAGSYRLEAFYFGKVNAGSPNTTSLAEFSIPTPGALSLLAMAAAGGFRRRRA
jgi:uncharacterized protein (TIGR03382 family)